MQNLKNYFIFVSQENAIYQPKKPMLQLRSGFLI